MPHALATSVRRSMLALALAAAAVSLTACGGGGAAPAAVTPVVAGISPVAQAPDTAKVDRYIQEQMTAMHIPGLTLAVVQDGAVVYAKAYGYSSLQGQVAARLEDRFQIGSMSKAFVAAAIMLLVEEGKVDLDQGVSRYLGPVPAGWSGMTVRHLLNHTSGLPKSPDAAVLAAFDVNAAYTDDDLLTIAGNMAMLGAPGGNWSYSNIGYDVLGILIAKVTGKPYADMLHKRIFEPLGMRDTRVMAPQQSQAGNATGYVRSNGVTQAYVYPAGQFAYLALGASGVESTALDMAKWDAALRTDVLLKKSSREQMWAANAVAAPHGPGISYGLGWFLSSADGVRKVFHSGSMPAFTSDFIRYPDVGLSVVILTNMEYPTSDPQSMTLFVARQFNPAMR